MKIACVDVPRATQTLLALDLIIVAIAFGLAYLTAESAALNRILFDSSAFQFTPVLGKLSSIFYGLIVLLSVFVMGLYQRNYMRGVRLVKSGIVAGILAWLIAGWPIAATGLLLGELSTIDLAMRHITLFAIVIAIRPVVCKFLNSFAKQRRIALVGSNAMMSLMNTATNRAWPADTVVVNQLLIDCTSEKEDLMGTLMDLFRRNDVDEIVVDLPSSDVDSLRNLKWFDGSSSSRARLVPKSAAIEQFGRWSDTHEAADAVAHVSGYAPVGIAKYAFERMLAVICLVFILPLMIGVMIAIKLDDGGPVFYQQDRIGKDNQVFGILKFRSMIQDAEPDGNAQWATIGDSRVTRVGRFIRRTRLDELPQMINIARGEMALVGPRPERPEIVEQLAANIPGYKLRHVVRPGLTGWAQINFPYGADLESAVRKTEFDLYYIKNWSIWLDLAIVAQTIRVVLFAEGGR